MNNLTRGCWDCARKHLGEAVTWFQEAELGHISHFWAGVGAMSHAERETLPLDRGAAAAIRAARHGCYKGVIPDVLTLIELLNERCGTPYGFEGCDGGCMIASGSPLRSQPDYGEREIVGRRARMIKLKKGGRK